VGCILCRKACPYDAIQMETTLSEPIRENVPNINKKLCRQCGACVKACKTGSIQLISSGNEDAHSEINDATCVRCGYCARVCPTEAIKYGEILPRSVVGGKAIVVDQKNCIGCMTCTRVCPSRGAINVGNVSKLPFINPSYCARCEECMNVCPSAAIKYSSRKRAYKNFSKIKTMEIVSELMEKEAGKLSTEAVKINGILESIAIDIGLKHAEANFKEDVTDLIKNRIKDIISSNLEIEDMEEIIDATTPNRNIKVIDDNCIGCGACINDCPVDCIELEIPSPVHIDDTCVFCGKCIDTCQFDAIKLKEEYFTVTNGKIYFVREELSGSRKGEIVNDVDACMACGICVKKCPTNALKLEKDEIIVDQDKCVLCSECEIICPVNAIKLKYESK
jgi:energy-converting hydrogenase A subunit Q